MSAPLVPAKRDVRRSFGQAAQTYDAHAFLQREIADRLFERLDYIKLAPRRVLDLGSGTGYATAKVAERYREAEVLALDHALAMLAAARTRHTPSLLKRVFGGAPVVRPLCGDAESLPLAAGSIDLVLSSLTLQWCDPQKVIAEAARVLAPTGLFMFTTLGPDTLKELRAAFRALDDKPHVNQFVDMHDLGDMMVGAGFADPVMDQEVITLTYTDLKPLLAELKGIGAHNVLPGRAPGLTGKARWLKMVQAYEAFRRDGRLPATYEVVYGHAWKPESTRQRQVDGVQGVSLEDFKRMVKHG